MKVSLSIREDVKLHEAENAWRPARLNKGEIPTDEDKKTEELYKKVRGVLNKLTPQKFETLLSQIKSLHIDTVERLQGVIDLVFEKAVDEPNFSVAYALMCKELALMQVSGIRFVPWSAIKKCFIFRCQLFTVPRRNQTLLISANYSSLGARWNSKNSLWTKAQGTRKSRKSRNALILIRRKTFNSN